MSNKTQLQANNSQLDNYITRINAAKEVATSLPEAGSSGSGNIETCTVIVDFSNTSHIISKYAFMAHGNSLTYIEAQLNEHIGSYSVTIPNVVCNSIFYVNHGTNINIMEYSITTDGGVELLNHSNIDALITAKAPSVGGSVGHVTLIRSGDDEGAPAI